MITGAIGEGKWAEKTLWAQAVKAEAGKGFGGGTGGFVRDGKKYYESFCLERLRVAPYQHGVHPVIVKMCYNFWRGPRILLAMDSLTPSLWHTPLGHSTGTLRATRPSPSRVTLMTTSH